MKHKTGIYLFAAILAGSALVYGCGGSAEVVHGEKMDWSKADDSTMVGKTITIEGYAELPMVMMDDAEKTTVRLLERLNQYNGNLLLLSIKNGKDDENTINEVPDDYAQTDIAITDSKGQKIKYGDKMRITGTIGKYYTTVEFIEKVDETFDFKASSVRLTDSSDIEALDLKLVYLEGEMYLADEQNSTTRMEMYCDDTTLSDYVLCKIKYGPLNNQADEEDDVVFRDKSGKKMGDGTRVRVYGQWLSEDQEIAVEYMEWISDPVEEDME